MKKLIVLVLTSILVFGCASISPIDTSKCIEIANVPQKNGVKSGDDLYQECIEQQHQKNESKKGFWENAADGLVFFVLDIIASQYSN